MKPTKPSLLLFQAIASLPPNSCSTNETEVTGIETSKTFIKFTAGGKTYNFEDIDTAEGNNITFNGNNGASLYDSGDIQISIWMPKTYDEGKYNMIDEFGTDCTVVFTSDVLGFDFDFAQKGSIVITKKTADYVEGTFTATLVSYNNSSKSIDISKGSFRSVTNP